MLSRWSGKMKFWPANPLKIRGSKYNGHPEINMKSEMLENCTIEILKLCDLRGLNRVKIIVFLCRISS